MFSLFSVAERKGFEPLIPFGIRAFQARALGQTTLPLHGIQRMRPKFYHCCPLLGREPIGSAKIPLR